MHCVACIWFSFWVFPLSTPTVLQKQSLLRGLTKKLATQGRPTKYISMKGWKILCSLIMKQNLRCYINSVLPSVIDDSILNNGPARFGVVARSTVIACMPGTIRSPGKAFPSSVMQQSLMTAAARQFLQGLNWYWTVAELFVTASWLQALSLDFSFS